MDMVRNSPAVQLADNLMAQIQEGKAAWASLKSGFMDGVRALRGGTSSATRSERAGRSGSGQASGSAGSGSAQMGRSGYELVASGSGEAAETEGLPLRRRRRLEEERLIRGEAALSATGRGEVGLQPMQPPEGGVPDLDPDLGRSLVAAGPVSAASSPRSARTAGGDGAESGRRR